jgi:TonB family protein
MRRATTALLSLTPLCLALLPLSRAAASEAAPDEWAETRAAFTVAMREVTAGIDGVIVTSRHRTDADQERLAALGYKPHSRSQHKIGLAWDVAAPEESLETLRDRAKERGLTALILKSPVTGLPYLHVQRFARSPLTAPPPATALAAVEAPVEPEPIEPAVETVTTPPRPVAGTELDLPRKLLRSKVDGRIVLLLQISETGRVLDLAVDASDLPAFDEHVVRAVRDWTFEPPLRDGQPVVATARLPIPIRIE